MLGTQRWTLWDHRTFVFLFPRWNKSPFSGFITYLFPVFDIPIKQIGRSKTGGQEELLMVCLWKIFPHSLSPHWVLTAVEGSKECLSIDVVTSNPEPLKTKLHSRPAVKSCSFSAKLCYMDQNSFGKWTIAFLGPLCGHFDLMEQHIGN